MADERLFGRAPDANGIDLDFDLVMEESLAANTYPAEKIAAANANAHTSLAAQFCTPAIWEQYKDAKSTGKAGWTMARAINSGVSYPSSFVGCHAGDRESYDDFKDFFYPVIEAYHKGFSMEVGSQLEGTASERMDATKIATDLSESAHTKIISTRIRVARNLSMFPLNPGGSKETRVAITELMAKVYAGLPDVAPELAGDFFLHSCMSDEQRQALVDGHQLFRGKDSMQAASGYHEHWPHGRGVFHNPSKSFVNWVNEGDHLRIISMESGGDVKGVFARLSVGAAAIEDCVRKETGEEGEVFMMHPKFGAVTCCPSNIGTGMRGSVHILVPKLIATIGFDAIDKLCRARNCQARGSSGEHSAVVDRIDVSNWRRIGFPEYELVNDMITCANFLAEEEDKVPKPEPEMPYQVLMKGVLVKDKAGALRQKTTRRLCVLAVKGGEPVLEYFATEDIDSEEVTTGYGDPVLKGELPLTGAQIVGLTDFKFTITVSKELYKNHKNAGIGIGLYTDEGDDEAKKTRMDRWRAAIEEVQITAFQKGLGIDSEAATLVGGLD